MWEYFALLGATIGLLYFLVQQYFQRNVGYWEKRGIKTLRSDLKAWNVITGKSSPMDGDVSYYKQLGDEKFGGFLEMGSPLIIIKDLDLAKSVLVKDFDYFVDRRKFAASDPFLSESLIFLNGQKWKDTRSFLSPTFTSGKIKRMFAQFDKSGERLQKYVTTQCPQSGNGYKSTVAELTKRFAVDIIGAVAFGMETKAFADVDSEFYKMARKSTSMDIFRIIRTVMLIWLPKVATFLNIQILDSDVNNFFLELLDQALEAREKNTENRDDFLQLLVEAKQGKMDVDENELEQFEKDAQIKSQDGKKNLQISHKSAVAQGFLFFVAGFDTVSSFLSNATYVLAGHPEVQEQLYNDIEAVMDSCDGKITYDGVNRMEYLDKFVSEVMRRYSPAQRLERKCMKDYKIPGTDKVIPEGVLVAIPVESIHLDEKYYPDPLTFDPERFTPENKAKRNAYSYMPFGIGPRNCIGMRFALIESKVAIAHLVHNFIIEPTEKTPIPVNIKTKMGNYRTDDSLELRFVPRR